MCGGRKGLLSHPLPESGEGMAGAGLSEMGRSVRTGH